MAYGNVTANDVAKILVANNSKRQELTIVNYSSTTDVFLGPDSSVTSSNGIPLFSLQRNDRWKGPAGSYLGDIYIICASGQTADIRYWEVER